MRCVTGEYYHILNRGVDGRKVFNVLADYERFKRGLLLFNTTKPVELRRASKSLFLKRLRLNKVERLIDVVSYCLLGNHFHLFVRQIIDGGIERFLRKHIGGYTRYFNLKYHRKGVLFQANTKIIHVNDEQYFRHVPRYIILNSLDGIDRKWREHGVKNIPQIRNALLKYPHSSIKGILRFEDDHILSHDLVGEIIDRENFMDDLMSWSSEEYSEVGTVCAEL